MLKPQINHSRSLQNLLPLHKPFVGGDATSHSSSSAYSPAILRQPTSTKKSNATGRTRSTSAGASIKAISIPFLSKATTVKGVITIQPTISSALEGVGVGGAVDVVSDLLGRSIMLELVSNDLDYMNKCIKTTVLDRRSHGDITTICLGMSLQTKTYAQGNKTTPRVTACEEL